MRIDPRTWLRNSLAGVSITFALPSLGIITPNFGILGAVFSILLLILSLGVHEAAHAWSAYKLGDSTAKDEGRMTLNPIVHIDLVWTILLPALCYFAGAPLFGGAKPVPVNFNRLRNPWADMAIVAFAGPLSNFLLAVLFFVAWKFFVITGYYNGAAEAAVLRVDDLLPAVLSGAILTNVILFVFNLIPIPPLDGSRIFVNLLPPALRENYLSLSFIGLFAIYALLNYVPSVRHVVYGQITPAVLHIVEQIATLGGRW